MKGVLTDFVIPLAIALVLFIGLVVFVFPTSTWLDQRVEASELESQLDVLTVERHQLRQQIARMRTDEEIERIARRDFNLVFPGEEAYAVLPAPPAPIDIPPSWPFSILWSETID